jgi:predicted phage terminase large subunit-like protein
MAALQYVHVPGYSAIIFRRTFSDLIQSDGLIPRSQEWLDGTDARWNGSDYAWHFPSGATVNFGYMKSDADRYRYKSAAFIRQLWEELTTFSEIQYTYVQSRSRRPAGFPVPIQSFAASNPDGPGAEWVAERFVNPDEETGEPQPELLPPGRRFIPSTLDDNPHLDTEEYDEQLALLDAVTRKQLRYGQWGLTQKGGQFDRTMVDIVDGIPDGLRLTRGWDLAATEPHPGAKDPDWTRGVLWGAKGGEYWVVDMVGAQANPGEVEALLKQTANLDAGEFGANRVTQKLPQDPGQAGKSQVRHLSKLLAGHVVATSPESGDKLTRAKPWLAACANGNVHLVRGPWNRAWLAECESFPGGAHDDIPDANSRAFEKVSAPAGGVGKPPTLRVPRIG